MEILDIIIVVVYMAGILGMGAFIGKENHDDEDYFAGGRSMPWYALGMSVGLTMISANSFIGGPGWAYFDGIMAAMVNISVPLAIFFITYTILPVVYNAKVTTVYEYVHLRLGTKTRILNVIAWLGQSLILIGGFVYTPSLVLEAITGISMDVWVPVIVAITIILTVVGGIKAVIWSDMIQGIILFIGLIIGIIVAVNVLPTDLGGALEIARVEGLLQSFDMSFEPNTLNIFCAIIGGLAMWLGYFGFDQGQVQRYISAKDMRTVKKTGVLSSLSMQVIYWLCFFLGVILFVFYQTTPPQYDFTSNTNLVMIDFLINHVPTGVVGILISAVFAAAISSIDSVLNSLTAVFIKDIYEPYISKQKNTPLRQSMIFTAIFGVLVIAFVYLYLGENSKAILETIASYIAPFGALLTGIMLVCCFMKTANDNGCFIGSVLSSIISLILMQIPAFTELKLHWLWAYFYGTVMVLVFTWIFSKFFHNEEECKARYKYTIQGTIEEVRGKTDDTGCSVEPLKFDKYGYIMIVIFVVQCIILVALQ